MVESERGCGWRQVGGVYLVCDGFGYVCDALPLPLDPCHCCGFEVGHARSMQPIRANYLASLMIDHHCKEDHDLCPLCYFGQPYQDAVAMTPEERDKCGVPNPPDVFYLMFVSKGFYTPESFMQESEKQGISKRVAANSLPAGFQIGKDWVFLAHGETLFMVDGAKVRKTGIFYAFKPTRLELLLWDDTSEELINDYKLAGYTVVLLKKTKTNLARHGNNKPPALPYGWLKKKRDRILKIKKEAADELNKWQEG